MFGENIKELRKERGVTQKELAAAIGVSQGAIFFWEKEINEPTAGCLIKIADYFGVSVDELLSYESAPKTEPTKEKIMFGYFSELKPEQQDILIGLARELSGK